jgi:hypothetical protein
MQVAGWKWKVVEEQVEHASLFPERDHWGPTETF